MRGNNSKMAFVRRIEKLFSNIKKMSGFPHTFPLNPDQGRADDAGGIAELIFDDGRFKVVAENIFRHFRDAFGVERIEV
jgi:hypothetical protein